MEFDFNLQNFQKLIIKDKNNLKFEKCLEEKYEEKSNFSKTFRNEIDIFINVLIKKGVTFYGFTINFPEWLDAEEPNQAWDIIHYRVEELFGFVSEKIELAEFCYVSIEKHKEEKINKLTKKSKKTEIQKNRNLNGLPHIHGILGVRNLLEKNKNLLNELKTIFYSNYNDIELKRLLNEKAVKNYWNYCIKENNFKFHRMMAYSQFFAYDFDRLSEHELKLIPKNCLYDEPIGYICGGYMYGSLNSDIRGVNSDEKNTKSQLIYFFSLYMHLKEIFLFKNELFTRIQKSRFSWSIIDSIDFLRKNNTKILEYLKQKFPQQLNYLNINKLLLESFEAVYNDIIKNNHYLPSIVFNTDIIEFSDGLYFLDYNYFLDFYKNKNLIKKAKINCYKYFDRTYSYCVKNPPKHWIQAIAKNIGESEIENFCSDLGRYFHIRKKVIEKKKKTLCIVGDSNTGKTTLVANIITQIIGLSNIGLISHNDSFAFEQIEDKKVIICDEFKYSITNRSNLLKIMDNEPILLNKKSIQQKLYVNQAPILFMFNKNINDKMLNDQAFLNRLLIYTFTYKIADKDSLINEILIEELPQIMIYCNNLFFSKKKSDIEITKYKKKLINNYINQLIE